MTLLYAATCKEHARDTPLQTLSTEMSVTIKSALPSVNYPNFYALRVAQVNEDPDNRQRSQDGSHYLSMLTVAVEHKHAVVEALDQPDREKCPYSAMMHTRVQQQQWRLPDSEETAKVLVELYKRSREEVKTE
ncbi:hypothetical protein D9615_006869 [Tricholomella constricta]|uniref:Uncharacterized protein n=1 Tax=Tricholomella constricta TaxID=117010 RepID=A0A8H5M2Z2_9AGAR|nr:hypothetical protein D9615_006869 [Tricholomella constricta]